MPFFLTRSNPEALKTDAKVIGSCPYRKGNFSSDWQPDLWAEQQRIQSLRVGEAMMTSGKEFDSKCGIVTLPPIWEGGQRKEALHLAACYDSSLRLAHKRRCRSIAFPLLSGDCNGFPRDLALKTAISVIREFLNKHEMVIYLSVKDAWVRYLPKPEIPELLSAPGEETLSPQQLFEQAIRAKSMPNPAACMEEACEAPEPKAKTFGFLKGKHLDQLVSNPGESFSEQLFSIIDERGLKDPQVYQKANLDRRLFSKIRSNPSYQPSKATALALCVALSLTLEQTEDLIGRAGYAFSPSNTWDIILKFYISQGKYDLFEINEALFLYNQPLLGA